MHLSTESSPESKLKITGGQLFAVINVFCIAFCVAIFVTKNKWKEIHLVCKVKKGLPKGLTSFL